MLIRQTLTRLTPTVSANNLCLLNKTILPAACQQTRQINLKPKLKEFVNCDYVDSMDYGIYALTTGYIKESAIEACRVAIVRKTKSREVKKLLCETPFTKKPVGTRMGKGKGKLDYWAASAVAGQWIFEFNCDNELKVREAFRQVAAKIPVRVHLRKRPTAPVKFLTVDEFKQMFVDDKERQERMKLAELYD